MRAFPCSSWLAAGLAPSPAFAEGAVAPAQATVEAPPELPYHEGAPVPPGYRVRTERATGLLIAGGVTFFAGCGAAYAAAVVVNGRLHLDGKSVDTLAFYPL